MTRSTAARVFSAAAILFCSAALAREGVLKTTNGTIYRGDIREDGDRFIVTVDKLEIFFFNYIYYSKIKLY